MSDERTHYPTGFFRSSDLTRMIERYMSEADVRKVYDAFIFAADAHDGVFRKSGEPYITHPLEVAGILADLYLDADTLCAALLHDVLEDVKYISREDLVGRFGESVAALVGGVTKLDQCDALPTKQAASVASFQRMMHAMTEDFRVVLIKLADRLHNMRTLEHQKPDSRRRIAKETFLLYVPLARRMGMNLIRRELQLLAFKSLYAWRSKILQHSLDHYVEDNRGKHDEIVRKVSDAITAIIPGCAVFPWEKNLYKIYERIKTEGKEFDEQREMLEIRVLVREPLECYLALGVIHSLYHPQMDKFSDFIANPKTYGFQALQTVVLAPSRQLVRLQIQTKSMYQVAQYGIAAQWRFSGGGSPTDKPDITQASLNRWLAQVRELDCQADNPNEFFADMQADLFLSEIYAFTPKGEVREFPKGATLVDFAYAIHTQVGNHCVGASVDGVERPLRTRIPNSAVIEVLTSPEASPQPSWLNFVVTAKAKSNIRNFLRQQAVDEQLALGTTILDNALRSQASSLEAVGPERQQEVLKTLGFADLKALYLAVGRGEQCAKLLTQRLLGNMQSIETRSDTPLLIKGTSGLLVNFEPCCHPLPHEAILARHNPKRGLEIHRSDCPVIAKLETTDEVLSVAWADTQGQKFTAGVVIEVRDVRGMLRQITKLMDDLDVGIDDLTITGDGSVKEDTLLVKVNDFSHLQEIIRHLRHVPNVLNVTRLTRGLA